jgi:hypothetical protein
MKASRKCVARVSTSKAVNLKGLSGKRVLFIGIGFYDYEASIVARLRAHGAIVDAFFDRPEIVREGVFAPAIRRFGLDVTYLIKSHERRILGHVGDHTYDYILVIKAAELRIEFLQLLRSKQAKAEFILYQWDSLARLPGIHDRIPYFDRLLTFDRRDAAEQPGMKFRPLFFRQEATPDAWPESAASIDLSFVGSLHSDRLSIIRNIEGLAEAAGMTTKVYLYTGLFTRLKLAMRSGARDVHARQLPYEKLMDINRKSAAILDLPHADQSGLTMRAIESVGLGKKLITTASDIVHYDFYSPENIRLISGANAIDLAFLRRPPEPVHERIRSRYSLDAWISDVFGLTGITC